MKISLGFSPCPNDTFIFDALVHRKIDTEGLEFSVIMEDVEALNQMAFAQQLDVTKLSYHAFAHLTDPYVLLDSGSALGNNCGPLLIAKRPMSPDEIQRARIAIPGKYTTANFLLSLAFPKAVNKTELVFSEIEDAVLREEADAGLIIHENRFTYAAKGLHKLIDLGEFWETQTQLPIPLGGIVIKRTLPEEVKATVNRVLQRSVAFAMDNPDASKKFICNHAQEMEERVMYQHINLYVNTYTLDLGAKGKKAVQKLFDSALERGIIPEFKTPIFLNY